MHALLFICLTFNVTSESAFRMRINTMKSRTELLMFASTLVSIQDKLPHGGEILQTGCAIVNEAFLT